MPTSVLDENLKEVVLQEGDNVCVLSSNKLLVILTTRVWTPIYVRQMMYKKHEKHWDFSVGYVYICVYMCSNVEAFRNGVEHSALEHSMEMAQSPNQAPYIKQV
jgi:hypothetical protein